MTLTTADQTYIQSTIVRAIEQLVVPRFDAIDRDILVMKEDIYNLKLGMREVNMQLDDIDGRLEALEADVKELYFIQTKQQNVTLTDKKFAKLPLETKIQVIDREVVAMAKKAGIRLQRPS
ncbi:MAG: hypothetical protein WAV04_02025 [Candidatus Microsaccharimonas sp.]